EPPAELPAVAAPPLPPVLPPPPAPPAPLDVSLASTMLPVITVVVMACGLVVRLVPATQKPCVRLPESVVSESALPDVVKLPLVAGVAVGMPMLPFWLTVAEQLQ